MKRKAVDKAQTMDRNAFLSEAIRRFPEFETQNVPSSQKLLHCEMADFRKMVEEAIDEGREWQAQKYMEFIEECLAKSGEALENAIRVSFVEDFALGEVTHRRKEVVRERMPERMRKAVVAVSSEWA